VGIETEPQRLFPHQLGCDYAQGRPFGAPAAAEEIGALLAPGPGAEPATGRSGLLLAAARARLGGGTGDHASGGACSAPATFEVPRPARETMIAATPTRLSVNLNKVALLRNQRDVGYPSVLEAARLVVQAGAHGITVHPRPDERHIRRRDVVELAALLRDELPAAIEYNIEGYPTPEFVALIGEVRPHQVTLVPDAPDQRTSDHGWDLKAGSGSLRAVIGELKASGARVSLFMDADPGAIGGAASVGADRIELYTGPYAHAFAQNEAGGLLARYVQAAAAAADAGLGVNAGHDLNLDNLPAFVHAIPRLAEVSIGHALTADALRLGFAAAVEAYLRALRRISLD
jgi:pyridoxine 5-phosphate synthase